MTLSLYFFVDIFFIDIVNKNGYFRGKMVIEIKNNIVTDIRLGFGGMAEIPKRATCVEKFLRKKSFTQANIVKASAKFLMDFSPISDLRGSKEYRETSAKNLLTKWWLEIENSQYYRLSCDFSENQITRVRK